MHPRQLKAGAAFGWDRWVRLIDRLPERLFAPEPKPAPPEPDQPSEQELEQYNKSIEQLQAFHDETSKIIRRVFYALVGTSLFCIVTVLSRADAALLASGAEVQLPILNYPMGFEAFLVVGPLLLIALTVYLHIFVGQHRRHELAEEYRQPTLPNFAGRTPQIVVALVYYWMVPLTLAVFAWKAYPRPAGPYLFWFTLGFAAVMVWLQMRRLPRQSRPWSVPLLYIFVSLAAVFFNIVSTRQLELFRVDLSGRDLPGINLSKAFMQEAQLNGANLTGAELNGTDLSKAQLNGANLTRAKLNGAVLFDAKLNCLTLKNGEEECVDLSWAQLNGADLSEAELTGVVLRSAKLNCLTLENGEEKCANLSDVWLDGADLSEAELNGANLSYAELNGADLSGALLNCLTLENGEEKCADLFEARLDGANLTGAELNGAVLRSAKLNCLKLKNKEEKCAVLSFAELIGADLNDAELIGAILSFAELIGADLNDAKLNGADLTGATITQAQLDTACGDKDTILPPGLTIKPCPTPSPEQSDVPVEE